MYEYFGLVKDSLDIMASNESQECLELLKQVKELAQKQARFDNFSLMEFIRQHQDQFTETRYNKKVLSKNGLKKYLSKENEY